MHRLGQTVLTILVFVVCALLILLGLHFVNDLFHFWPIHVDSITPCDKFEVFRDLLIILLATIGVVGYFIYKQTRNKLDEDLEKSLERHENEILARLYGELNFCHFREYDMLNPTKDPQFSGLVDLAIWETEKAISFYERIGDEEQNGMVNVFRMNLAYHLAIRGKQEDKDRALLLARDNWRKASDYMSGEEYNFREILVRVVLTYSEDEDEKKRARKELNDLMKWTNIPKPWKEQRVERYNRDFKMSLQL